MVNTYEAMMYSHWKCKKSRVVKGTKFVCIRNHRILYKTRAEKTRGRQMLPSACIWSWDFHNVGKSTGSPKEVLLGRRAGGELQLTCSQWTHASRGSLYSSLVITATTKSRLGDGSGCDCEAKSPKANAILVSAWLKQRALKLTAN